MEWNEIEWTQSNGSPSNCVAVNIRREEVIYEPVLKETKS